MSRVETDLVEDDLVYPIDDPDTEDAPEVHREPLRFRMLRKAVDKKPRAHGWYRATVVCSRDGVRLLAPTD